MMCCDFCRIAEASDVKLKEICNACKSVRYCSVKCKREHISWHRRDCKMLAAELHNKILFKQPESSHFGDCPICLLPLSLDSDKHSLMGCCSKLVCEGCNYANQMREFTEKLKKKCPFCRHPTPKLQEEAEKNNMKRVEVNDQVALCQMGMHRYIEGDYNGAVEYSTKAAELGDVQSHYNLSIMYDKGEGVEKDRKKAVYHWEQAAISGHPEARQNGRHERAMKHFIIAAKLGYDGSLGSLKDAYGKGYVSKDDFATALRAHQAAVDATKSPQREAAEVVLRRQW